MGNSLTLTFPYQISDQDSDTIRSISEFQSTVIRSSYNVCYKNDLTDQNTVRKILETEYDFSSYITKDHALFLYAIREGIKCYKLDRGVAKYRKEGFRSRVFGGRKEFIRYMRGLIDKEEWRNKRVRGIVTDGEGGYQNGSRKFDFLSDQIIFKPWRGTKIYFDVPKLRGKYQEIYQAILSAIDEKKCPPVMVKLIRGEIQLSVDKDKLKPFLTKNRKYPIRGRYLGIDLNPNYIGASFYNERKELLDTRLYEFKSLTDKGSNPNKLRHEIIEVCHEIGRIARGYRIQWIFLEDLKELGGNTNKGKYYNRLVNNQFIRDLPKQILRNYGTLREVNSAYSSTIGNILHDYPDPIASSMEIARRGIENRITKGSGKYFPPKPTIEYLKERIGQDVPLEVFRGGWREIHSYLKKSAFRVRRPVPLDGYRCFGGTVRSGVGTIGSIEFRGANYNFSNGLERY